MTDLLEGWPFWAVYALFCFGGIARSQAIYWLGRGVRRGSNRSRRLARRLDSRHVREAERLVARFGAPAVTLSFLTVGLQTAVQLSAGALRMPMRGRYLPASIVGTLVWAAIYTTVGFAVVEAWLTGTLAPWLPLLLVPTALVVLATWWARRLAARR
ncbi:DedA family protein [Actinomycetota bacterium]